MAEIQLIQNVFKHQTINQYMQNSTMWTESNNVFLLLPQKSI